MVRYNRKTSVAINAWDCKDLIHEGGTSWYKIPEPIRQSYEKGGWVFTNSCIYVPTIGGGDVAGIDDMIIQMNNGQFYVCPKTLFNTIYEEVEEGNSDE